jgi:hypothetical protein
LDRFVQVECIGGSAFDDIIMGDDRTAAENVGLGLLNDQLKDDEQFDRYPGLREVGSVMMPGEQILGGNLLLGGPGDDVIVGRAGVNYIDGDRFFKVSVCVDSTVPETQACWDSLSDRGLPGDVLPLDFDTAAFPDVLTPLLIPGQPLESIMCNQDCKNTEARRLLEALHIQRRVVLEEHGCDTLLVFSPAVVTGTLDARIDVMVPDGAGDALGLAGAQEIPGQYIVKNMEYLATVSLVDDDDIADLDLADKCSHDVTLSSCTPANVVIFPPGAAPQCMCTLCKQDLTVLAAGDVLQGGLCEFITHFEILGPWADQASPGVVCTDPVGKAADVNKVLMRETFKIHAGVAFLGA